jgi:hypothetical protein
MTKKSTTHPIFLRMNGSEGSSYSFDPRLQHYSGSQRDPSAPGPYQPYSYQGYALPQVSPLGYGPGPHASSSTLRLSQNPGNVVNTTPLQFRNTFAPHEIPSCAPLAPISFSQPLFLNHHWSRKYRQHHGNELPRQGPGGQFPSALDVQMLKMLGLWHPHLILTYLSLRLGPLFLQLAQLPTNILHLWRLPQFFQRTGRIPGLPLMSGFV